jgi:hypothetical protein
LIGGGAPPLARGRNWLYLDISNRRNGSNAVLRLRAPIASLRMAQPMSTLQEIPGVLRPPRRLAHAIVAAAAGLVTVLALAAVVLWFHYGTAVFFETIVSGLSACF